MDSRQLDFVDYLNEPNKIFEKKLQMEIEHIHYDFKATESKLTENSKGEVTW